MNVSRETPHQEEEEVFCFTLATLMKSFDFWGGREGWETGFRVSEGGGDFWDFFSLILCS